MVTGGRGRWRIENVLGRADDIEAVLEGLLVERGARMRFEKHTIPKPTIEGREDLRSLLTFTIADGMGERLEDFAQQFMTRIGEAIGLVGDIATVVGHLLGYLLAPHRKAVEMREDQVTIDPALRAARDQIERERRKAKAV